MYPLTRSTSRARFFGAAPSLLLDFLSGSLDSRITFTRASTATFFNSSGVLTSASNDVARFDYNPATLAPLGLLIEESRTNSIRNNTMVGAVAGTPGTLPTNWFTFTAVTGLTQTIVGTGTESGVTYVDIRFSGTPSGSGFYQIGFEGQNNVAALTGQAWTQSAYLKLQAGSYAGISATRFGFNEYTSAPAFVAVNYVTVSAATGAGLSTQRRSATQTLNGGATTAFVQPFIDLTLTGVAIDITLRIGLPQLEQGAFATSVIPTTTTALTRAADVASVNTLSPWFNAVEGTVVVQFSPSASAYSVYNRVWQLGTIGNYIAYAAEGTSSGRFYVYSEVASATQVFAYSPAGAVAANSANRQAFAYKLNDYAWSHNGGSAGTDTSATVPSVSVLSIGQQSGTGQIGGWIQRLTYYPRRLANAELQAITA
jgi:hypothetical protein